jgi:hypothetical protein
LFLDTACFAYATISLVRTRRQHARTRFVAYAKQAAQDWSDAMGRKPCMSLAKEAREWFNNVATLEDECPDFAPVTPSNSSGCTPSNGSTTTCQAMVRQYWFTCGTSMALTASKTKYTVSRMNVIIHYDIHSNDRATFRICNEIDVISFLPL